jgi:hypothetical protein
VMWLTLAAKLAWADDFDIQPSGQALVGQDWQCPEQRQMCTRPSRAASLLGIWTAPLDGQGRGHTLTFSVVWTGRDFPVPTPTATGVADPWKEAVTALERFEREHSGWQLVSRTDGDPAGVVCRRESEQRTLAAWTTTLTTEEEGPTGRPRSMCRGSSRRHHESGPCGVTSKDEPSTFALAQRRMSSRVLATRRA